ncbi:sensor histidine kinase [Pseudonocardia nigra]|uniref:sensor histidine kinase n=1 Tax=Pseudonocardia nigra TaxID=1921578 RepID=UPI001C5F4E58|nr:sensor histidine kinase [Pseudonocardia nigra]
MGTQDRLIGDPDMVDEHASDGSAPSRFVHEAAIYDSDEAFLGVAVPFLRDGVLAGVPTLLSIGARQHRLVREALGDVAGVTVLDDRYAQPFTALQLNHEMFREYVAAGVRQVRILGEVPHPGTGAPWDGWVRYEAAINHLFAAFPVWAICPYDLRNTPPDVLVDVTRTHDRLASADGGHRANPDYAEPAEFLAERVRREVDPLERTRPDLDLVDASPAAARRAVAQLGRSTEVPASRVEDLVVAVNEVVTNAIVHGRPPVVLRAWGVPDRVVVAVRDQGAGPADPYAGLLPDTSAGVPERHGLWMAHQLCSRVSLTRASDGFTVRLVAGTPRPMTSGA